MFALDTTWLKFAAIGLFGAFALSSAAFLLGRSVGNSEGRAEIEIEAAKNAFARIEEMETNNAAFRDLTPRQRCLAYAWDSGLPDSTCD